MYNKFKDNRHLPAGARQEKQEAEAKKLEGYKTTLSKAKKQPVKEAYPFHLLLQPFKEFFIIDPIGYQFKTKSSSNERKFLELVKHVFVKYKAPQQLNVSWLRIYNNFEISYNHFGATPSATVGTAYKNAEEWCKWYITIAQGRSLIKTNAKDQLTKREVHTFLNTSYDLTPAQLYVYSIAKTFILPYQDGIALRIAKSKISELVEWNTPANKKEFVKTVIYFFAKNHPESIHQLNDLLDFIMAKWQETYIDPKKVPFSMNGQTIEGLKKKTQDWHYALRRVKDLGNDSWEGAAIADKTYNEYDTYGQPVKWIFKQLKNTKELATEGNEMRHCVYSYKQKCINNEIYIWSLSRQYGESVKKAVTIELRNSGYIAQARGIANRWLREEERSIIRKWARDNNLRTDEVI